QPRLIDPEHLAARELVSPANLGSLAEKLPFVVKAVTGESTGGGIDVYPCRGVADLDIARSRFEICREVVVEEWLEFDRSFCLSFAVGTDGSIRELGAAEQITLPDLTQQGSWFETLEPPAIMREACRRVVERAASLGYAGICGIDAADTKDGRTVLFDLNFRINASTIPRLMFDSVRKSRSEIGAAKVRSFAPEAAFEDIARVVSSEIDRGAVLPYIVFDPEGHPAPNARPVVRLLLLGEDRGAVLALEKELDARFRSGSPGRVSSKGASHTAPSPP
ncbi:MAG TPA: hypothetical protein VM534_05250, partial [Thermoanaerobaculia bacterium]|nr:hypothetical protein [Thermoanaerobaculia bacterium]